jgi:DNA polymerase-1
MLFKRQTQELTPQLRALHDMMTRNSMTLMESEVEGVKVDPKVLDELQDEYLGILEGLENELKPWLMNPRSWQQVKAALLDLGIAVPDTQKETLELVLEKVEKEGESGVFLTKLLEHRKAAKLYGTYIKGIRKRLIDGRVHTTFLIHGTTTGRLSSRNPNMQNIPRGDVIRKMFVPEEGNVFVQADYGQIELRIAALLSEDEYLIDVFNDESRDLFDELGVTLYGEQALGPLRKQLRIRTKAYAYGVNYGREAFSIAQEYRITPKEAQEGMDQFFGRVPQLVQWREDVRHQILHSQDDLVNPFGRVRRFWLITNDNRKDVVKEGLAFIPQSTASDVNLAAMTELRDLGLKTKIPVHDSILVECKESEAEDVVATMQRVMEDTAAYLLGDKVKFVAEASIGKSWGEV